MSQKDGFDVAGSGSQVNLRDLVGKTVLFAPTEFVEVDKDEKGRVILDAQGNPAGGGVMTKEYGRKDAIIADLVVIDGDNGPEVYKDAMIFSTKTFGALKRRIGRKYLAVPNWGTEKIRGNFPMLLTEPTEAQVQMARDYLAGRTVAAALPSAQSDEDDPFAVKQ